MSIDDHDSEQREPLIVLESQAEKLAEVIPLVIRKIVRREIFSTDLTKHAPDEIRRGAIPKSESFGKLKRGQSFVDSTLSPMRGAPPGDFPPGRPTAHSPKVDH